jgi:hypothetical protein
MKVVRLSALRTGRLYPLRKYPWYSFVSVAGVDPRAIVRLEELCQWKIPMTTSGIERETSGSCRSRLNHRPMLTTATNLIYSACEGRDCSVGIATLYKLNVPGIEPRCRWDLPSRPDRPWSPSSLPHNGYRVFTGGKAAGGGVDHPTPTSAEVKEIGIVHWFTVIQKTTGHRRTCPWNWRRISAVGEYNDTTNALVYNKILI